MEKVEQDHFFYVLYCADKTFYAGYTTELARREAEHNTGKGAKYTRPRHRRPVKLVYAERYPTRSQAMKQEAAFKRLTRRQKEAFLMTRQVKRRTANLGTVIVDGE